MKHKFVICLKNEDYQASLELRKIYELLPDPEAAKNDLIRLIDESGEDYLYPKNWFADINISPKLEEALLET
ncbi:hypothetical protein ACFL4W_04270 [Planctomycetota bacterium]